MKNWKFHIAYHFTILQLRLGVHISTNKLLYLIQCCKDLNMIETLITIYFATFEFSNSKHYKQSFVFQVIDGNTFPLEIVEVTLKCLFKSDYLSRFMSIRSVQSLLERHDESTKRYYKSSFEHKKHLLLGCNMSLINMLSLATVCNNKLYNDIIRRKLLQSYIGDLINNTVYTNNEIYLAFRSPYMSYLIEYNHPMMLVLLRQVCRFSTNKEIEKIENMYPKLGPDIQKWKSK